MPQQRSDINATESPQFWLLQSQKVTETHKQQYRDLSGVKNKFNIFFSIFQKDFPELSALSKLYKENKAQSEAFKKRVMYHLFQKKEK